MKLKVSVLFFPKKARFELKTRLPNGSFLDNELIEHHDKYAGKRISRGLFKSKEGTIINTDVNSAYNILKKAFLNAVEADRIEDVRLHPTRWRLAAVTS